MNIFKNGVEAIKNIRGTKTVLPDGRVQYIRRPLTGKWSTKVEEGKVEPISIPKLVVGGAAVVGTVVGGAIVGKNVYDKKMNSGEEEMKICGSTEEEPKA